MRRVTLAARSVTASQQATQPIESHVLRRTWHFLAIEADVSPLGTGSGGKKLADWGAAYGAVLVVIDSYNAVTQGDENNSNDTCRNFDLFTSRRLKALGCTVVIADHIAKAVKKAIALLTVR